MKNVRVLDATLRDGGRIIDCAFSDTRTEDMITRLANAGMDVIEVGFLRDEKKVNYQGNSTFFTDVEQIERFLGEKKQKQTLYVAFIDYGMFDFSTLKPYNGKSVDGVRVGFVKKDFKNDYNGVVNALKCVKEKGYKLFIQGVNSLGYTDKELLEMVEMVNTVKPYSFGIVDTYGAMYIEDVQRIYNLIDHNLARGICINFHSHNNFQLSFSFAQEIIRMSRGIRNVIIDATLNGMGKCAGNLNTELIVDYLVRKMHYNYDFDAILDIIDDHMYHFRKKYNWGYSIPSMMAGIYKSHPNNILYLTSQFRLATKDIKYILSMIDPQLRQRYDYDNIQQLYIKYNHTKVDDSKALERIKQTLTGKELLLLLPGGSIKTHEAKINQIIKEKDPCVISVNFVSDKGNKDCRFAFFGSMKRYHMSKSERASEKTIVVSNIRSDNNKDIVVNYESLIEREFKYFDNTMIMLLNLLRHIGIDKFMIAGFDGFGANKKNFFDEDNFSHEYVNDKEINTDMLKMLDRYALGLEKKDTIKFITPSVYEKIFSEER